MKWFVDFLKNLNMFTKVLLIILISWGIWELVQNYRRKKAATPLDNEEFNRNIRQAQLIDVRDRDEFKVEHILGARSMPYAELQQRYVELRHDQPIYLYDDSSYFAYRAAIFLKKKGFTDLYVLEDGFSGWDGRIKTNKKHLED